MSIQSLQSRIDDLEDKLLITTQFIDREIIKRQIKGYEYLIRRLQKRVRPQV